MIPNWWLFIEEISSDATPCASSSNLKPVDEMMGNLEILDEYGNREDEEKYDRLAIVGYSSS